MSSVFIREEAGVERPIYYISRAMVDLETIYPNIEKLALALMVSCIKFRPYLLNDQGYIEDFIYGIQGIYEEIQEHIREEIREILHSWREESRKIFKECENSMAKTMIKFVVANVKLSKKVVTKVETNSANNLTAKTNTFDLFIKIIMVKIARKADSWLELVDKKYPKFIHKAKTWFKDQEYKVTQDYALFSIMSICYFYLRYLKRIKPIAIRPPVAEVVRWYNQLLRLI